MSKGKVFGTCMLGLLAYGYFLYLPKQYISENSEAVLAYATEQDAFVYLRYTDAVLGTPKPILNRFNLTQMTFSTPVTVEGKQSHLFYVTVSLSLNITYDTIAPEWKIVSVSAE